MRPAAFRSPLRSIEQLSAVANGGSSPARLNPPVAHEETEAGKNHHVLTKGDETTFRLSKCIFAACSER